MGAARRFGTLFFCFTESISSGFEIVFFVERESFVSGDFMYRSQRQTGQEERRPAAAIEPQNVAAWIHKHA